MPEPLPTLDRVRPFSIERLDAVHDNNAFTHQSLHFTSQSYLGKYTGCIGTGFGRRLACKQRCARHARAWTSGRHRSNSRMFTRKAQAARAYDWILHQHVRVQQYAMRAYACLGQSRNPRVDAAAADALFQCSLQTVPAFPGKVRKFWTMRQPSILRRQEQPAVVRLIGTVQRTAAERILPGRFIPLLARVVGVWGSMEQKTGLRSGVGGVSQGP
jgi:hypothetical protein